MTFDIRTLAISNTADMPVRDAAGEKQFDADGNPCSITLFSPGTKKYNSAMHARNTRNSERVMQKMQGKADGKQSADDAIEERAEFLASVTSSFNNFGIEGLAGYDLCRAVYSDLEIGHIADGAEKFLAERANFMRPCMKG